MMYVVKEHSDLDALATLQSDWRRLLSATPGGDFFHTFDWLEVYWRHFGAGHQLRVLALTSDDGVVGIVPLVERDHATPLGAFRKLTFPLDYWGSFYGPIGADRERLLAAAIAHVATEARDWDYLELNWLDQTSLLADTAEHALWQLGMQGKRQLDFDTSIAKLGASWEDYWAGRSGNWRSNCRRNEKKLAKQGTIEHVRYRPRGQEFGEEDPRWDLYEQCERIAAASWQASSTDGTTISHASVRQFLRDAHEAATRAGCVDLNLLLVDGEPIAFNYNYVYRGYVSSLRLGFLPEFRQYGPGTVLTRRMLRDSCQRGDHTFDFLPGSGKVKRPWRTKVCGGEQLRYVPGRLSRVGLWETGKSIVERLRGRDSELAKLAVED
ncbi:MAG: GNAT family N-acetyltransferase [Planctomycetota bacterium]|nr:MAG: GNAT family N-acetyltransferase [Planctomycetota bacterium]REJ90017.1 MAG: GNAT family N-acetyltransferase [Planctomycetota bacterium]REK22402.1 MAG: GNAT family N-acetyltransferase [Planctomycetota bacterium]REK39738.1 MAG: GNAT family N-acetyltransferase [Planctomycetota bacterium]